MESVDAAGLARVERIAKLQRDLRLALFKEENSEISVDNEGLEDMVVHLIQKGFLVSRHIEDAIMHTVEGWSRADVSSVMWNLANYGVLDLNLNRNWEIAKLKNLSSLRKMRRDRK
jgi:hypothetical protein